MSESDAIRVGIIGAAGRGKSFARAIEANGARIAAVCDINEEALPEAAEKLGAEQSFTDAEGMMDREQLDAVVVGTPMHFHVPQSVMALDRGLHVLSEVPAGVSIEECRALVTAAGRSKALYMMAENYTYMRQNVLVRELARQGLFGRAYYAEGEYLHELKGLNEKTTWRRKWQTGINGITYGTHSLGPILQWMPGDRVVSVCCAGSGHHYTDPRGDEYENEDSCAMLCKTARGALIKIRVDMLSDRPHAMTNYQFQGTDGAYESARNGPGDVPKLWLRKLHGDEPKWHDVNELLDDPEFKEAHLPATWANPPEAALAAGHGGGDFFEVLDFVRAIRGETPCPIGIHEAMDMTLPGLISQQSIAEGGRWLRVPDSRDWEAGRPEGQLHMRWSGDRVQGPPRIPVPKDYALRQFRAGEGAAYAELLVSVGFDGWDKAKVERTVVPRVVPNGWFVVEHKPTGRLVATAVANHEYGGGHPRGGEVGWVATDPAHRGKGLGKAVTAAATRRLVEVGYDDIFLRTDDNRLPAVAVYLKLGFEPVLYKEDMAKRWENVRIALASREE